MSAGGGTELAAGSPDRPEQSIFGLWNISFGFFGIQIGFALQNANVSRIFQSLGTPIDALPILWIAAPLTGLLVQPLIGFFSDRTWGRLGRRRPYFLGGALLSTLALIAMPNANGLIVAALLLWLLDASLNVSMEPFRAFVGDMLPSRQRPAGYAFQTGFIGAGAVAASLAPWLLNDVFGLPNTSADGGVPPAVRYSFYIGAAALLIAVLWTVLTTREYPPEAVAEAVTDAPTSARPVSNTGLIWIGAGAAWTAAILWLGLDAQLYLLGGLLAVYGGAKLFAARRIRTGRGSDIVSHIVSDLEHMPPTMARLAVVQFFTWSALFMMWIFTTPVVAQNVFGSADPASRAYNEGADWVGVLFAIYNGVAVLWTFAVPALIRAVGRRETHVIGLAAGAIGFASFLFARDPTVLIGSMVLIGIAWSSILTLPYAILCDALPPQKLGTYMGLFNLFIVLPQITVAAALGSVVKALFPTNPLPVMAMAAVTMTIAALAMLTLKNEDRPAGRVGSAARAV